MKKIIFYHNPRCSKSREALALLQGKKCDLKVIEYLKKPLSKTKITGLLKKLSLTPIEIIRIKEPCFAALNLSNASKKEVLINAIVENPILLERPIAETEDKAVIARPPENILTLIK